jgi:hypothetical protein
MAAASAAGGGVQGVSGQRRDRPGGSAPVGGARALARECGGVRVFQQPQKVRGVGLLEGRGEGSAVRATQGQAERIGAREELAG